MSTQAPSASDLGKEIGKLKKVTTKEGAGPGSSEVAAYAKVYDDAGGDLNIIASKLGVKFKPGVSFANGEAFGKSFLAGLCLLD